MKKFLKILILLFAVLPSSIAMANGDITGTWQGNLVIGPDAAFTTELVISEDANGSYAIT